MFLRLGSQKPRHVRCFLLLVAKTTLFGMFLDSTKVPGWKWKRNIAPGAFMDDDPRDLSLHGGVNSIARSDNFLPAKHVDWVGCLVEMASQGRLDRPSALFTPSSGSASFWRWSIQIGKAQDEAIEVAAHNHGTGLAVDRICRSNGVPEVPRVTSDLRAKTLVFAQFSACCKKWSFDAKITKPIAWSLRLSFCLLFNMWRRWKHEGARWRKPNCRAMGPSSATDAPTQDQVAHAKRNLRPPSCAMLDPSPPSCLWKGTSCHRRDNTHLSSAKNHIGKGCLVWHAAVEGQSLWQISSLRARLGCPFYRELFHQRTKTCGPATFFACFIWTCPAYIFGQAKAQTGLGYAREPLASWMDG